MMSEKTNVNSILIFPSSSSSFSSFARAAFLLLLYNYLLRFPFATMVSFLEVGGVKSSYDYHLACWEACNFLLTPRR